MPAMPFRVSCGKKKFFLEEMACHLGAIRCNKRSRQPDVMMTQTKMCSVLREAVPLVFLSTDRNDFADNVVLVIFTLRS